MKEFCVNERRIIMNRMIPYRTNNPQLRRSHFIASPFDDTFFRNFFGNVPQTNSMRMDVKETETGYVVEAEMPGLNKENIELKLEADILTISTKYEKSEKEEKDGYLRCERRSSSSSRSFDISGIDQENIKARYENGLLYVTLPKGAEPKDTSRNIVVE